MISKSTICFNFGFKARGIFLTGVNTGVTLSLIPIWCVCFRVPISPEQYKNSDKNCSSLTITAEMCFTRFRLSLIANPRIDRDFELTTINKTSKWSFLHFRVNEHFPSPGILDYMWITLCSLCRSQVQDQTFSKLSIEKHYIELWYQFCKKQESHWSLELLTNQSFHYWFG